jgi:hypothetical protein
MERRQQRKHTKNVTVHYIRAKTEQIRHQKWILHQGVNEAAAKNKIKKAGRKENEERQRIRTLDGEIMEGKCCHSSDLREERTCPDIFYIL